MTNFLSCCNQTDFYITWVTRTGRQSIPVDLVWQNVHVFVNLQHAPRPGKSVVQDVVGHTCYMFDNGAFIWQTFLRFK